MDSKIQKNLQTAKGHYYAMRLVEAYNILRRYYDRLPFQAEAEHAEYIGMFLRILSELGKTFELHFYMETLEKLHAKTPHPAIAYQLGMVYFFLKEPRYEAGKKMLESLLRHPDAQDYHIRAKMMLAQYYKTVHSDIGASRQLIDSIGVCNDPHLQPLISVWQAVILLEEKNYAEAEITLRSVLASTTLETNWYACFVAKLNLACVFIERREVDKASQMIAEIEELFKGKNFKLLNFHIAELKKVIVAQSKPGPMKLSLIDGEKILTYEKKSLSLNTKIPSDKLLMLLAKRGYLDKAFIVKTLYSRSYDAKRDDKLIYYHIHTLRKRLGEMGVPSDAILSEDGGYRLVSEVETLEEEL